MALILDPRLAVVWRSPASVQIGVDQPVVTLHDLSIADERMLAALIPGISASGLAMTGASAGATDAQIGSFLAAVRPALISTKPTPATPQFSVALDGSGPTIDHLQLLFEDSGIKALISNAENAAGEVDAAVLIAHFVVAPQRAGAWLRRDIPHLPVVFGDAEVRVGPFVEPGISPCLHCLDLRRRDADPSWPAMASQLLGRTGTTENLNVSWEVATLVFRLLTSRLRLDQSGAPQKTRTNSVHLDAETGSVIEKAHRQHAECGCRSLPGTEMVGVLPSDSTRRIRPMTAAANVAPA